MKKEEKGPFDLLQKKEGYFIPLYFVLRMGPKAGLLQTRGKIGGGSSQIGGGWREGEKRRAQGSPWRREGDLWVS